MSRAGRPSSQLVTEIAANIRRLEAGEGLLQPIDSKLRY